MPSEPNKTEPSNIAETFFKELPRLATVSEVPLDTQDLTKPIIHAIPNGMTTKDFLPDAIKAAQTHKPLARIGLATLDDLSSFIAWTNRHKGDGSVIFARGSEKEHSLTAVIDYNLEGAPSISPTGDPLARHAQHRGRYSFPFSKEWQAWNKACASPLTGPELGELIEDRAEDIINPSPAINGTGQPNADEATMIEIATKLGGRFGGFTALQKLANEFKMQESTGMMAKTNRDTGETTVQFINEHKEPDGSPISIPTLFMIGIPVFENSTAYRIAVRLRYRRAGTGVVWILSLYNPQSKIDDAWNDAVTETGLQTELPVFAGMPEGR